MNLICKTQTNFCIVNIYRLSLFYHKLSGVRIVSLLSQTFLLPITLDSVVLKFITDAGLSFTVNNLLLTGAPDVPYAAILLILSILSPEIIDEEEEAYPLPPRPAILNFFLS